MNDTIYAYIRALLINPFLKQVTAIQFTPELKEYYRILECQTITMVGIGLRTHLVLDDEGLFVPAGKQAYFSLSGYSQSHLAGKALLVGMNEEGDEVNCNLSADKIATLITWENAPDGDELNNLTKVEVMSW